jgi:hypothetical protein
MSRKAGTLLLPWLPEAVGTERPDAPRISETGLVDDRVACFRVTPDLLPLDRPPDPRSTTLSCAGGRGSEIGLRELRRPRPIDLPAPAQPTRLRVPRMRRLGQRRPRHAVARRSLRRTRAGTRSGTPAGPPTAEHLRRASPEPPGPTALRTAPRTSRGRRGTRPTCNVASPSVQPRRVGSCWLAGPRRGGTHAGSRTAARPRGFEKTISSVALRPAAVSIASSIASRVMSSCALARSASASSGNVVEAALSISAWMRRRVEDRPSPVIGSSLEMAAGGELLHPMAPPCRGGVTGWKRSGLKPLTRWRGWGRGTSRPGGRCPESIGHAAIFVTQP